MLTLLYSILISSLKISINDNLYEGNSFDEILKSFGSDINKIKSLVVHEGKFVVNSLSNRYTGLNSLIVPKECFIGSINDGLFKNIISLKAIIINGATSIGVSAFEHCTQLETVQFDACTIINYNAFQYCLSLKNVSIPNVQIIKNNAFTNAISLKNINYPKVISVSSFAFYQCSGIINVVLNSCTSIGAFSFYGCSSLSNVYLPQLITLKGDSHFEKCISLKSICLKKLINVNSRSSKIFAECPLTSIYLPEIPPKTFHKDTFHNKNITIYGLSNDILKKYDSNTDVIGDIKNDNKWCGINLIQLQFSTSLATKSQKFEDKMQLLASDKSGNCGENVRFIYIGSTGTLTISGSGKMYDYNINDDSPWFKYRFQINSVIIESGVTSVGAYAFRGSSMTTITLSDTITEIGVSGFSSCELFTHISIPRSVISIEPGAFLGCINLVSIQLNNDYCIKMFTSSKSTIPYDQIKMITLGDTITSICKNAFRSCIALETIIVPNTINSIGISAFWSCIKLKSITIPDGVAIIDKLAFYNCETLETIFIPKSVTFIGLNIIQCCKKLKKIEVDENNQNYISIDDILYSKNGTILMGYPCAKSATFFEIPESVTKIDDRAFEECSLINTIKIPEGITEIIDKTFYMCNGLISFEVAENNPNFASFNGLIYSKDFSSIISVPQKIYGDLSLHDNLKSIKKSAFSMCNKLTSILIPETTTEIGDHAFNSCSSISSIIIPKSIISIGEYAFYYCTSLTLVEMNNNYHVTRFKNVFQYSLIKSVTLGEGITSISDSAFSNCEALESIVIPETLNEIGKSSFSECHALKSLSIPKFVTEIKESTFLNCRELPSMQLPNNVEKIGNSAFSGCAKLTSINIPDKMMLIGDSAFIWCSFLESINIPDSVISIGNYAFKYCFKLVSVTIGKGITSIGELAFGNCEILFSFTVSENNLYYSSYDGILYVKNFTSILNVPLAKTGTLKLHDNLISIEWSSFSDCINITSIEFGKSLSTIGRYAFGRCRGITSLIIPPSVELIDEYAFNECSGLTSLSIPSSVAKINNHAFNNCVELASVVCYVTSDLFADSSIFNNCNKLNSIDVPMNYNGDTFCGIPVNKILQPDLTSNILDEDTSDTVFESSNKNDEYDYSTSSNNEIIFSDNSQDSTSNVVEVQTSNGHKEDYTNEIDDSSYSSNYIISSDDNSSNNQIHSSPSYYSFEDDKSSDYIDKTEPNGNSSNNNNNKGSKIGIIAGSVVGALVVIAIIIIIVIMYVKKVGCFKEGGGSSLSEGENTFDII